MSSEPLVCPTCASTHPLTERFCPGCGMPLVYAGRTGADEPITEQHERARKVKPQYSEGRLVRVAGAANQAEAELMAGMLLEEGIPTLVRRRRGFDVPDFLAAGPRDLLVPESGVEAARDVLLETREPRADAPAAPPQGTQAKRLIAGLLLAVIVAAVLVTLVTRVAG